MHSNFVITVTCFFTVSATAHYDTGKECNHIPGEESRLLLVVSTDFSKLHYLTPLITSCRSNGF